MKRKLDFKKGDECIVAICSMSNASRRFAMMNLENINEWTYKGIVQTSGKKYITVAWNGDKTRFCVEDNYREFYIRGGADHILYKNIQELANEIEHKELICEIKYILLNEYTSLEKLRKIKAILNENNI